MSKRVLIVGAGVVGLSAAFYCAQKGHRVTVIDRSGEHAEGCSFGNAGMIVPSHFIPLAAPGAIKLAMQWMLNPRSPFAIKPRLDLDLLSWGARFFLASNHSHVRRAAPLLRDLQLGSRGCYEELAGVSGGDFSLTTLGLMMLCRTSHAMEEEAAAAQYAKQLNIPARVMSAREAAELEPNVRMDIAGAVHYPADCCMIPARFMQFLRHQLSAAGAGFGWNCRLVGWRQKGSRILAARTTVGELDADEFVVCAGAWTPAILKQLRLNLPMQGGKGYSLTLAHPRARPRICSILTEGRVAVTPMGSALRFAGTIEIGASDLSIDPRRVRGIVESIPRYFPDFRTEDFDGVVPWAGLRPCSPDGLPYVGHTRRFTNLCISSGHAMLGMSLGPITGKLLSQILSDQRPEIEISMPSPDRYASA